ncbi:iron transporter [Sphingopyxis sp.]|uniref:iron transporter n=1 Tax=Sphingopyxis sp. TaxID=1908224 RepID=UPI002ED994D7
MNLSPSQSILRAIPVARAIARLLLASAGGYAFAVAVAYVVARGLPMERAEATVVASLAAILAMPAAAIWAYGVPRLWHAAAGILGATAICAAIAWSIGQPV